MKKEKGSLAVIGMVMIFLSSIAIMVDQTQDLKECEAKRVALEEKLQECN